MTRSSRLAGFYNQPIEERIEQVARWAELTGDEAAVLRGAMGLDLTRADQMIENVVGLHSLPLGVAVNFVVNGRDVLVPMAIEEPSVVAGASFAAKLARAGGGFQATTTAPQMRATQSSSAWAAGRETWRCAFSSRPRSARCW